MMSPEKKIRVKQGAILGFLVGIFLFAILYFLNNAVAYVMFIPLATAMGAASQYVKLDEYEDQ